MTNVSSMNEAGAPVPVLWDNPEDRVDREVEGRGGGRCSGWASISVADSC